VFVALVIQLAMHMRLIVICGQSCTTVYLHIVSWRHDFKKMSLNIQCLLIFCIIFVRNVSV